MNRARVAGTAMAVAVGLASPAAALDLGQWVPGLKLSPFLSERVDYETNIFQTPSNSQSDVIFKTIPGFVADYTFGPHALSAGYRAEILNYARLTNQDTVHHIMATQLRLDFPRLFVNVRDDFIRTSDPPGTELTGRILSTTNILKPEAEYRWTGRLSTGLNYTWTRVRFDDPAIGDLIDRDEHAIGASVFWKVLPRADIALGYTYARDEFTVATDRDFARHFVTVGVRGDITPKLSSTFRIGVELREPDHPSVQPRATLLTMGGQWVYKPTERTTITLVTDRSTQESTFGTTVFYTTTNAFLTAQHQLLPKLLVGARLGGGMNDYSTKQTLGDKTDFRRDTFLAAGAQADYALQPWLRLGVEYLRTSRDSNFPAFRFVDERITGRVTLQF
jgi:hypothetical protein